jgi:protein phosphatase
MVQTGEIEREDMRFHPNKNIITRALGASKNAIPDYFEVNLKTDDTILMCSDGLSNMVGDHEIMAIVKEYPDNLQLAAKELVKRANENGGIDNISIIIVKL